MRRGQAGLVQLDVWMDEKVSATVKCLLDTDWCCFQGENTQDINSFYMHSVQKFQDTCSFKTLDALLKT